MLLSKRLLRHRKRHQRAKPPNKTWRVLEVSNFTELEKGYVTGKLISNGHLSFLCGPAAQAEGQPGKGIEKQ
jgi:hypothetical protein